MLGSAVSSSTPKDFQPSSHMGVLASRPLMNRHAAPGPAMGCPYAAVGMQRALDSAIGLPRRSTSALWMLVFLMPADVRRSLILPFLVTVVWVDPALPEPAPFAPGRVWHPIAGRGQAPAAAALELSRYLLARRPSIRSGRAGF